MREGLPPVKNPSAREVRAHITTFDGRPATMEISNQVDGKFHFKSCPTEFWITIEEFDDIRKKLTETL